MRIVSEGRRQIIGALTLLAAAGAAAPVVGCAAAEAGAQCTTDADCTTVLCPCNWIPISRRNEAALAGCRDLQEISRCGSITPDGRPRAVCRASVCRDANVSAPAVSSDPALPGHAFPPSDMARAPSDGVRAWSLINSGQLYDGMTRDDAVRLLGEPTSESAELLEWRYEAAATRRYEAGLSAAKRGSRLYDWRTGSAGPGDGQGDAP